MISSLYQPKRITIFICFFQIVLLFSYLIVNIYSVGQKGVALPLLAGFVGATCLLLISYLMRFNLSIRLHFFVFLLFVSWVALRIVIDLGDMQYLKELMIGTTGGIFLFFLLGNFARQALENISQTSLSRLYLRLLLLLFMFFSLIVFLGFKNRLNRVDVFFIDGVNSLYQRPGNFLIVLFIMVSFIYLSLATHPLAKRFLSFSIWLGAYTLGCVFALISSQMIGSNAATANLLAIYMMTAVLSLLALNRRLRIRFEKSEVSLYLSKSALKKLFFYSAITTLVVLFLAVIAVEVTGFDLSKTRAFGFGSGTNESLVSRFDILLNTGFNQLNYAPFFGDLNVAKLTTGNAGRTLHSFIPNVMAELGLVGLFLVIIVFAAVFKVLIRNIKKSPRNIEGFKINIINYWLLFIFVWLFLYANISVGKSWLVMWFFTGFAANVFIFNYRRSIR